MFSENASRMSSVTKSRIDSQSPARREQDCFSANSRGEKHAKTAVKASLKVPKRGRDISSLSPRDAKYDIKSATLSKSQSPQPRLEGRNVDVASSTFSTKRSKKVNIKEEDEV